MKKYKMSKLSLTVVSLAIIMFIASMLYLKKMNHGYISNREKGSSESDPSLNQPLQSTDSVVADPMFPVVSPSIQTEEAEWKTYRDEKFKFTIQYPQKGWKFTSKVGSGVLSYNTVRESINLYTARSVLEQGSISAPITIAIYEKPAIDIVDWLSVSYGENLSNIQKGGVDTVLARAYAGETDVFSYNKSQIDGTTIYEVGRIWSNGYAISFATFFMTENIPYIYEVSFLLPYYGSDLVIDQSDNEYIKTYKQIISTFRFTE